MGDLRRSNIDIYLEFSTHWLTFPRQVPNHPGLLALVCSNRLLCLQPFPHLHHTHNAWSHTIRLRTHKYSLLWGLSHKVHFQFRFEVIILSYTLPRSSYLPFSFKSHCLFQSTSWKWRIDLNITKMGAGAKNVIGSLPKLGNLSKWCHIILERPKECS